MQEKREGPLDWNSPALEGLFSSGTFRWHQQFTSRQKVSPGGSETEEIFRRSVIKQDLSRKKVLDIGTTNGFGAFYCERRGADVTATDIADPSVFGFEEIRKALGSRTKFVRASVMNILDIIEPKSFDIVLFWGVFYHLRHPLAALEIVSQIAREFISLETAVFNSEEPLMMFCEASSFMDDGSNWWLPTESLLHAMLADLGIDVVNSDSNYGGQFGRCLVEGKVSRNPAMLSYSYEPRVRSVAYDSLIPSRTA